MFRVVRKTVGIAVQNLWPGFDEQDARLARIDGAEVPRQRVARQVGDRPRQFDAGRAAADDHESEQRREPRRVGFALGFLERQENAAADCGGVFDRLQPGRRRLPFVMAEIAVAGARGDDQRVVGNRASNSEAHDAGRRIHARHHPEYGRDVLAVVEHRSDRPRDLRRRQRRGRDLVQKRLEEVMIALVDQGDVDRRPLQALHRPQAAEAGADDDHAMPLRTIASCRHCDDPLHRGVN